MLCPPDTRQALSWKTDREFVPFVFTKLKHGPHEAAATAPKRKGTGTSLSNMMSFLTKIDVLKRGPPRNMRSSRHDLLEPCSSSQAPQGPSRVSQNLLSLCSIFRSPSATEPMFPGCTSRTKKSLCIPVLPVPSAKTENIQIKPQTQERKK